MVTLTCPLCADITVTEEHAKRILAHPLNQVEGAKWSVKKENATKDAGTDTGVGQEPEGQGAQAESAKPRGKAKAAQ